MRVLRVSYHHNMTAPPDMVIVRESDLTTNIEDADEILTRPGDPVCVVSEIFEMPDGDITDAVMEARERAVARAMYDRNLAVLYWWTAGHFRMMRDGGTIATQDPSPLAAEDITSIFSQLTKRTDYRGFRFVTVADDGQTVVYPPKGGTKVKQHGA